MSAYLKELRKRQIEKERIKKVALNKGKCKHMFEESLDAIECLISLTEDFDFYRKQNYFEIFEKAKTFITINVYGYNISNLIIERINKNEAKISVFFYLDESYIEKIQNFSTMRVSIINREFMHSIGLFNLNYYKVTITINNLQKSISRNHFIEVVNILLEALKVEKQKEIV